jgi:GT2 family glycosyltransferase
MTIDCINSFENCDGEIVVIEDGGANSDKIRRLSDIYLYKRKNKGFTDSVNLAIQVSSYDFVMCVNNDIKLVSGDLKDLCVKDVVTSPRIENQPTIQNFAGSFFCLPKQVVDKVGFLDERLVMYCSDTEYKQRLARFGVKMTTVSSVVVTHKIKQTADDSTKQAKLDSSLYDKIKKDKYSDS